MHANPFYFSKPVSDPALFLCREREIRQIAGRLLSAAPESTSVTGEQGMGKTSLLAYLADAGTAQRLGLTPDHFCLLPVNGSGDEASTPLCFWQVVLERLAQAALVAEVQAAADALRQTEDIDILALEDVLALAGQHDLRVVLLVDDFESIARNEHFNAGFFGALASLATNGPLSLIAASERDPGGERCRTALQRSPLFALLANVSLHPLSRPDVSEIIERYSAAGGVTLEEWEKTKIIHGLGHSNPYLVQMAAYWTVEGKLRRRLRGRELETYVGEKVTARAKELQEPAPIVAKVLEPPQPARPAQPAQQPGQEEEQKPAQEPADAPPATAAPSQREAASTREKGSPVPPPVPPESAPLVFISAKSEDYRYAGQVYRFLVDNQVPVFFSRESLPRLGKSNFRRQIAQALDQAKHLVVVTSRSEYVESGWVEAEWGIFVTERNSGRKDGNLITITVGGLPPTDLPLELRACEVIPFEELDKLLDYVR
jgi:hypothetical protein